MSKFTFVVPVYNSEDTIVDCIKALFDQRSVRYKIDYDVLVVDDGSSDSTLQLIKNFDVNIVSLGANFGRVEARRQGAIHAKTELLAFIDSRVIADSDLAFNIIKLGYKPAIAGNLNLTKSKYASFFDTVFFLIRRRYYGPEFIKTEPSDSYITRSNFLKSPKGTTMLVISKNIFLKLIPDNYSKDTSDDTLLLHRLIFEYDRQILRSAKLGITYMNRKELSKVVPWLFHRGKLFSDYYLKRTGIYRRQFGLFMISIILMIVLAVILPVAMWLFVILYLAVCAYLAENIRDFVVCLVMIPLIGVVFGSGVICGFKFKTVSI